MSDKVALEELVKRMAAKWRAYQHSYDCCAFCDASFNEFENEGRVHEARHGSHCEYVIAKGMGLAK